MTLVSTPRRKLGEQAAARFRIRGSTASEGSLRGGPHRVPLRPVAKAKNRDFATVTTPNAAEAALLCAFYCFPHASPAIAPGAGKQETAPKARSMHLICLEKF